MIDKATETLLDSLKQAMLASGDQRLFKSGKLDGLFPSKAGLNATAAAQAIRDNLLEVVRTETKGKITIEWVRITPKGVELVHHHESPTRAMDELQHALQATLDGVPVWMSGIRQELQALGNRLTEEVQNVCHRLEVLSQRVTEALGKTDSHVAPLPGDLMASIPWGVAVLDYLAKRRTGGAANDCLLPEVFRAVREQQPALTVKDFHDGLRRLHDRGALRLLPYTGAHEALPEPEYALPDGNVLYYSVAR
jgi:hypothetical protein